MFLLLVWWHLLVHCYSSGSFSVDKLKKNCLSVLEDIRFLTNLGECFAPHLCFLLNVHKENTFKWLVEHIWCSLRVIWRQGRASLKIPKLRHLEDFGVSKLMNLEIYEKVWLRIFFYARICYFNLEWHYKHPNLFIPGGCKYPTRLTFRGQNFDKKWSKNDRSGIDPESFQDGPGTSRIS